MTTQTEHHQLADSPFRLGEWLVEPRLNRLTRGGELIQLELKVMDVLVCLAERAGEVVSRREIVDQVWATEFIADNTLTHAITDLRNAFGDDARSPMYIETIHGRGYRLIAPVIVEGRASATVARFPVSKAAAAPTDRSPYPGLAAFTETDAEFFFGREAETAQMWRKITTRRLLAVIGPSGVGKSSLLRAGVIPAKPDSWGVLICQPGETPFGALARALVPQFAGDIEATSQLVGIRDGDRAVALISRWRDRSHQALLIVDQFEELLTLSSQDVQASFADTLRRVVDEADVHVLLAMRDDFLFRCHDFASLAPVFDMVTPMNAPAADALRRALVEPARRLGFAFEDDSLAEEMVSEVEGERGALPMLAFTVARLWEQRDRERSLLTRQAYHDIGGVAGSLARHAETTIDRIGQENLPVVRELFRNLVTVEATRAVREWDELLSVFDRSQRGTAAEVLCELINARLLTSYEVREEDEAPTRRVEIIHESLLANWPRLVRWQTQDADAAQLRDQLRQAACTWDEHGRTDHMLWTGSAYREFASWRERYPGGLTETEEAFSAAMTSLATRRRRRRRLAVTTIIVVLLVGFAIVGAFWRRSVLETRRAEAAKLLALAQVELNSSPSDALAYTTASLELADTEPARRMVIEALAAGPPGTVLDMGPGPYPDNNDAAHHVVFSPDGIWAAIEGFRSIRVVRSDGSVNRSLARFGPEMAGDAVAAFDPSGGRLYGCRNEVRTWSLPEFQVIDSRTVAAEWSYPVATRQGLYLITYPADTDDIVVSLYSSDGEVNAIGSIDQHWPVDIDRQGRWLAFARDGELFVRRLEAWDLPYRRIAHLDEPVRIVRFAGDRLAAELESGELWIWPVESGADAIGPFPVHERGCFFFDEQGDWLGVYRSQTDFSVEVWNLRTGRRSPTPVWRFPASVSTASSYFNGASFTPGARWVAAGNVTAATFWPLRRGEPQVLAEGIVTGTGLGVRELAFTPDGRSLIATVQVGGFGEEAQIWVWDLVNGGAARTVASVSWINFTQLAVDPMARFVGVSTYDGVELVPLGGGPTRLLQGYTPGTWIGDIAIDAEGRRVAACARFGSGGDNVIRIWDIKTGEETVLGPPEGDFSEMGAVTLGLRFLPNGFLLSSGSGLRIWNLATKNSELVMPGPCTQISVFGDGRYAAVLAVEEDRKSTFVQIADLETRNSWVLPSRISNPSWIAADPAGTVVVSAALGNDAAVQVVPIPDGEPRLLVGHERGIRHVAVSPDGRFVATAGNEGTVRLWPMPDLSKPPLHTLPREELIAKLKTLTNLRVVRDPDSATGWKLDVGPFPGWETVPTW